MLEKKVYILIIDKKRIKYLEYFKKMKTTFILKKKKLTIHKKKKFDEKMQN
jgi:hypothetical protein